MKTPIHIQRIAPPSLNEFVRKYLKVQQPTVIENLTDSWPALKKWSIEYFAAHYGKTEAGTIPVTNGFCDFNTTTGSRLIYQPLEESINSISQGKIDKGYAIATPAEVFPDVLHHDYSPPIYCANGKYLRARIFLGTKGTVTSLHQDLFYNLYTMVKGSKRITLYAPNAPVYPNSRFSKLPNHAQVDPENPDYNKYPNFRDAVAYVVDLKAGETLFIPPFWWHHLHNLEESIAVSFWWAEGWVLPLAWLAAQYKKLRGI